MPLVLRLPFKRGFTNIFKERFHVVNVERLGEFEAGSEITPEALAAAGLIRDTELPVKLLGDGDISRPLKVRVQKWSKSAQEKVEAAGGTLERLTE